MVNRKRRAMSITTTDSSDKDYEEDFEWTSYNEVQLIYCMGTLKPLGLNQHFVMTNIIENFCAAIGRSIPANIIIEKVESYYNLTEGRKRDTKPYQSQCEFSLPLSDYNINKLSDLPSTAEKDRKQWAKKKSMEKKPPAKRPRHTQ